MATSAPDRDSSHQHGEHEDRTRLAWVAYRDSLRDLRGEDYDEAERRSWDRLQRRLSEIEDERSSTTAGGGPADIPR